MVLSSQYWSSIKRRNKKDGEGVDRDLAIQLAWQITCVLEK